jgi:hypothetical protein
MLSSIHPLGERARHNRWSVTAAAYIVSSIAGGAVVGAASGTVGGLMRLDVPATVAVAIAGAVIAAELIAPGRRWPGLRRQVNEDWLVRYRGWVYGSGFGLQLGTGIVTQITTTAIYGWIVCAALTAEPSTGAAIGAIFGLVRAAPLLLLRRVNTADELRTFHVRLHR